MTKHCNKYEPEERIRWLAWGHFVLSDRPFTNAEKLSHIERLMGIIVADAFAEHANDKLLRST